MDSNASFPFVSPKGKPVKKQNFSRKRQSILEAIHSTCTHPTAEWIYQTLKPQFPDLSLGTVYRNISSFKEQGLVVRVATVNGQERLDGNLSPHSHFICDQCGAVVDILEDLINASADRKVTEQYGVCVTSHEVLFHGLCSACSQKSC